MIYFLIIIITFILNGKNDYAITFLTKRIPAICNETTNLCSFVYRSCLVCEVLCKSFAVQRNKPSGLYPVHQNYLALPISRGSLRMKTRFNANSDRRLLI